MMSQNGSDPGQKEIRRVILASSLGTIFEWYDFFIYGTLASSFGKLFFTATSDIAGLLLALATFGVGFAVRPFGAIIFGVIGDRVGRKHTFIVTIALMGAATAGIGFLPTYETIGVLAPVLLVTLRALQGFALGGEYGGAAIYVAEHASSHKRGLYTAFIQAGVPTGLLLSLIVTMVTSWIVGEQAWAIWGWRVPFLFSLLLLGVSLWIRLQLAESPIFEAMKDAGTTSQSPLKESFGTWPKIGRISIAFIVTCGQAVGAYMALFQGMYFLQNILHVRTDIARAIAIFAAISGIGSYILFGWLSDHVGRKKPIVIGFVLTIFLLFPIFRFIAAHGSPAFLSAISSHPVVVTGNDCHYNPFASKQVSDCSKLLDALSKKGISYSKVDGTPGTLLTIGGVKIDVNDSQMLEKQLKAAGYGLEAVVPPAKSIALISLSFVLVYALAAMTYGPLAALLVEMFPAPVRYTSLSIPYHFANGYAGGFLPFISQYIVAKTGDPFGGLWYPVFVVSVALLISIFFLPETLSKKDLKWTRSFP